MKPIVFLDFDGVIMTADSYEKAQLAGWSLSRRLAVRFMDPKLVANVSTLCTTIGADVCISSAWRGDIDTLEKALHDNGLAPFVPVVGETPHSLSGYRGREIQSWLEKSRPGYTDEDIVVLDDNSDLEPFIKRWVQSTWERGFDDACLRAALSFHYRNDKRRSAA